MSNILVTGAQMGNKGAQAMAFTVVNEMKSRFPDKEIILFNVSDERVSLEEQNKYAFTLLNVNKRLKINLLGGMYKGLSRLVSGSTSNVAEVKHVIENTDLMIDISGFALSSQFNVGSSLNYIANLMLAKKYGIPMYLFPQSFGPFAYKGMVRIVITALLKQYLKVPKVIYAREEEGYRHIEPFTSSNLRQSVDIVLQGTRKIDRSNVYNKPYIIEKDPVNIENNSVAIIPNVKTLKHGSEDQMYEIYTAYIHHLLDHDHTVYLLRHSEEDLKICDEIKRQFMNDDKVILLDEDYDCIELQKLLKQFEFVIASRYHSIIHAYKSGVPVIVFGWATKYVELLNTFSQSKYLFDVRDQVDLDDMIEKLSSMMMNKLKERELIMKRMKSIQEQNIFVECFE